MEGVNPMSEDPGEVHWTTFGDVEVGRVVEWLGPIGTVDQMFPDTPAEPWSTQLHPHFWRAADRSYRAAIQTWVVRSASGMALIDTGVGNQRNRPQVPAFDHLDTDFLSR